jgi:hypothetical protein
MLADDDCPDQVGHHSDLATVAVWHRRKAESVAPVQIGGIVDRPG